MNVTQAVLKRRSTRAFKPDIPPLSMIRDILDHAGRAPSGGNLQPWRVHVLTGAPLNELQALAAVAPMGEAIEYDVYPPDLWDPYRARRFQAGEALYAAIAIPREDKAGRLRQLARNIQFFGAPVGLYISIDRGLGPPQWADLGIFIQTVMLLATERGLSSCAQEFWAAYPQLLRDHLGLGEQHMIFCGMALGWADDDAPINDLRTSRDPVDSWAEFRGFE